MQICKHELAFYNTYNYLNCFIFYIFSNSFLHPFCMYLVKFFYWCLISISICKELHEHKAMIPLCKRQQTESQKIPWESLQHWLWVPQKTIRMTYGNEMQMKCISTELSMLEDNWSEKDSLDVIFYFHCKTVPSRRVVTVDGVLMALTCGLAQPGRTRNGKKDVCWLHTIQKA